MNKLVEIMLDYSMKNISDIHLESNGNIYYKEKLKLYKSNRSVCDKELRNFGKLYLDNKEYNKIYLGESISKKISIGKANYRMTSFLSDGIIVYSFRKIPNSIIPLNKLGLEEILENIIKNYNRGLILVTGTTGSGKSTTIASIINHLNTHKNYNILTLEDPVEYQHISNRSLIRHRDKNIDFNSFDVAIRDSLRKDIDILYIGEIRDKETISAALRAAETGHIVISTMHTDGISNTITRILDFFENRDIIRYQLSMLLKCIINQKLVINDKHIEAKYRICLSDIAFENMIRRNKIHQIDEWMHILNL